jgi:DNA-directed RNA polymerase subunit RPC12/RpoP
MISMLNKTLYTCPNTICQKKFENLIIVHDNSNMHTDIYYACPHCLTKLDPTSTQILEKEEFLVEAKAEDEEALLEEEILPEEETEGAHQEKEIPSACPEYFGYLRNHLKNKQFLEECLICPKNFGLHTRAKGV